MNVVPGSGTRIEIDASTDQQSSDEKLQPFSFALLPEEKLHADDSIPHIANRSGVNDHGRHIFGDLQREIEYRADLDFGLGLQGATAHGNIDDNSLTFDILAKKRHGKFHFDALVLAPILVDPHIAHAPLTMPETLTAKLTLKGVDIEVTEQKFENPGAGNAPDKLPAAVGTF